MSSVHRSLRLTLTSLLLALLTAIAPASTMTVDLTHRGAAPLKKGGLGSLFGVGTVGGKLPDPLLDHSILWITSHQGRVADNGSDPFSTDSVAPLIRGTDIRMMCRLNDLVGGFEPYDWKGLAFWDQQITAAIQDITANYADVVYAVEVFNEPDREWYSAAFASDPDVQGSGVDARINWLWTHTVQEIKAINPNLKIMGPNYQSYLPEYSAHAADQQRMQNFLQNALATHTMPDIIGWHSLYNNEPADIGNSLSYYRALEKQLSIPNAPLPISINEYGVNNGAFEGIPGKVVQFWGEMERDGIDFGGTGVYTNYGQLGNTTRYPWFLDQQQAQPNGGWFMQNWYNAMTGVYVPVSAASTRYDLAYDGVASYDPASHSVTVILGGSDDDADITFTGLDKVGLAGRVRVRVDSTFWTTDPIQSDQRPERGGDPETATYNLTDTITSAGATFTVPIHKLDHNNGYRIVISPATRPDQYPTKFEAENANLGNGATVQRGTSNVSGGRYVQTGSGDSSAIRFNVTVPTAGVYFLYARYSTLSPELSQQKLTVNGVKQGVIAYPATTGGPQNEFTFAAKRVALNAGANSVVLRSGTGSVALDYIDVRPDTHRYEAEFAFINDANTAPYLYGSLEPNFVGGLNDISANVTFAIDAPATGTYALAVHYGNGSGSTAIDDVFVNGLASGQVQLPATAGYIGGNDPRRVEGTATVQVPLAAGSNNVRLQKNTLFSELDYVTITPVTLGSSPATAAVESAQTAHAADSASPRSRPEPPGAAGVALTPAASTRTLLADCRAVLYPPRTSPFGPNVA